MTTQDLKCDPTKWREDQTDYDEEAEMGDASDITDDLQDTRTALDNSAIEADYDSCDQEWNPACEQVTSGKTKVFASDLDRELDELKTGRKTT